MPPARRIRPAVVWIVVFLVLLILNVYFSNRATGPASRIRVPYSPFFLNQVQDGHVKSITSTGSAIQGTFTRAESFQGSRATKQFATQIPAFADKNSLSHLLQTKGVVLNAHPIDTGSSWWASLLLGFGPTILFVLLLFWLLRRAGGGAGMLSNFTRATARRYQPSADQITFAQVAGIDEAKDELSEVVDFLRHPGRYRELGGRIPRGVLLSGPPGTGKTLLARAVAGEANVPFFSMAASEFVEAIVGVGASRVRDLFKQAKAAAPAIVFIDELDAVGRSRNSAGFGGGNDEREQTLNQILTEMDGFDSSTNVIVVGATNRPEVLDEALLRPGRFDRRVAVQAPDRAGREAILRVHARDVPLGSDVDLGRIAATTPGMVGADLANLVNEAALLAARRNHSVVSESDLADALERIILGAERKVMMSPEDKRRSAYHESGHAIVGMLTRGADPVRKVSIVPRGHALGVTFAAPDTDHLLYRAAELEAKIKVALGGRAAEAVVFGETSTGAESDIEQLTGLARQMVGRWGMSEAVGPLTVIPRDGASPYLPGSAETSPATQQLIDDEVRRVVDQAQQQVMDLLRDNRSRLDGLASALLEHETLDQSDAYAAAGVPENVAVVGLPGRPDGASPSQA